MVVPKPEDEPEPEGCGLAPNTTMTQVDKYDYLIPLPKKILQILIMNLYHLVLCKLKRAMYNPELSG
eukprot:COSAG03_NODE_22692_length_288_cov_0.539683_1_plen_66_part_01